MIIYSNKLLRIKCIKQHLSRGYCDINKRLSDFPLAYKPKEFEEGKYELWMKNDYFTYKEGSKEPFKMILPPPNVTGILHLGHALTGTIQDILARWYRMNGTPVLWIPGLDHAGIATQVVVEKYLKNQKGVTRQNLSKEEFLKLTWEWKEDKGKTIKDQLKKLGLSLDWSREYFTLSKEHCNVVTKAFVKLHERKLLFRDKDLVNWSPALQSVISDIEVENVEITERTKLDIPGYKSPVSFGEIIEFSFKVENSDEDISVVTTRPETVFGDVAIAVHPQDERYSHLIAKRVWHPLRETFIPIVPHSLVKPDFGTGAVKVTPAHDRTDYAIAKDHKLESITAIDEMGNLTSGAKEFEGLPRYIARKKIIDKMSNIGVLKSKREHKMIIPRCSRSGDVVEYQMKEQWFLNCDNMAQRAMKAVSDGHLKIDPEIHHEKWFDWLTNVRKWCVSRQLYWGHSIPAYLCTSSSGCEWIIAETREQAESIAKAKFGNDVEITQDKDVLDTWFSSVLLPFSSLGWPNENYKKLYPLSMMETGHDILFFWVARMVMLGLEFTDQLPFKEVLLHGVLCDGQGKKMSKSRGNTIYPEHVINGISLKDLNAEADKNFKLGLLNKDELKRTMTINNKMFPKGIPECGTDALRFTLCSHNIKTLGINFVIAEAEANKRFCNKILQACRYTLLVTGDNENLQVSEPKCSLDRWILSRLALMIQISNDAFENREFARAVRAIREFFYYEFCDFYLEATKVGFESEDKEIIESHKFTLIKCIEASLRALAPLMPHLADELYSRLSQKLPMFQSVNSLIEAPYPKTEEFQSLRITRLEDDVNRVINVIDSFRGLSLIHRKLFVSGHIVVNDQESHEIYSEHRNLIKGVSRVGEIEVQFSNSYKKTANTIYNKTGSDVYLYMLLKDAEAMETFKSDVLNRKQKIEKELETLRMSARKNKSEESKFKEKIEILEGRLESLPKMSVS